MRLLGNNYEYLVEMASTDMLHLSIGEVILTVRPRERGGNGNVPHFHVHRTDTDYYGMDITIRLDEARYFIHGRHTGTLKTTDRKKLMNFLNDPYNPFMTNWEFLVTEWNRYHLDNKVTAETCPNYRKCTI